MWNNRAFTLKNEREGEREWDDPQRISNEHVHRRVSTEVIRCTTLYRLTTTTTTIFVGRHTLVIMIMIFFNVRERINAYIYIYI